MADVPPHSLCFLTKWRTVPQTKQIKQVAASKAITVGRRLSFIAEYRDALTPQQAAVAGTSCHTDRECRNGL